MVYTIEMAMKFCLGQVMAARFPLNSALDLVTEIFDVLDENNISREQCDNIYEAVLAYLVESDRFFVDDKTEIVYYSCIHHWETDNAPLTKIEDPKAYRKITMLLLKTFGDNCLDIEYKVPYYIPSHHEQMQSRNDSDEYYIF